MTKQYSSIEIRKLDKGYLVSKNDPVSSLPQPIAALTSFEEVLRVLREHFEEVKTPAPTPSIGIWAAMKDPLRQQAETPKDDFTYELYADGNVPKVGDHVMFANAWAFGSNQRVVVKVEKHRVKTELPRGEAPRTSSWWAPSCFKLVRRADEAPRPGMLSGGVVPCAKPALKFPSQQAENFDDCA